MVVYPPGTTAGERRRVRIWRGWPLWGALLWATVYTRMPEIRDDGRAEPLRRY